MPKKPITGQYFSFRNGERGFSWEGMATKVDPGGSPPNRPRYMGDCRIQGGSIISAPEYWGHGTMVPPGPRLTKNYDPDNRPPFQNSTGAVGWWDKHWIGVHNTLGVNRLWWGGFPAFDYTGVPPDWVQLESGASIGFIDIDTDPPFNNVATYPANDTWTPSIEKFNREVYFGDYGKLRKLQQVVPPPGKDPSEIHPSPPDETVVTFPGFRCAVLQE
jgi:hypothetical protein